MNKFIKTALSSLFCVCVFSATAGEKLDLVNAKVDKKAEQIDETYGVLLTSQERNNLKIKLVVNDVVTDLAADETATVKAKVDKAVLTYDVTDPIDQRQLLIEVEAAYTNGDGIKPPCCK
jgi:hypothetical protein